MTKAVLLLFAVLAASACQAGWESWLRTRLYGASFESYEKGQELSDLGTEHGTWGVPAEPVGATAFAAADSGPGQYIEFSTDKIGLIFTPDSTGDRALKSVMTSAQLLAYEDELPDLSVVNPRGAFAMYAPENGGTNFVGWTDGEWVFLQSSTIAADPGLWYDVSMKFIDSNGVVSVQYRLKRQEDAEYETLHAADDPEVVTFRAGSGSSDAVVNKVEFQGEGAFRRLSGSEPRRGLLIGLVPWRELLIDESVYHQGSGNWTNVFNYVTKQWEIRPGIVDGDAYGIKVPEGESYTGFKPNEQASDGREVIEFTVNFMGPNDNDAAPTNDVCALVRLVEMPLTNVKQVNLDYQFACLANGGWHTNTNPNIKADVDSDYTVEVTLDRNLDGKRTGQTVSYRIKRGRGAEAGSYQELLMDVPVSIGDPLFTFFGGIGKVYSIKSSKTTAK